MSQAAGWPLVQDLPGILPTRQRRSQETTVALLEAGAELLRDCAFDELSIDELCRRVGVTDRRVLRPVRKQGRVLRRADVARRRGAACWRSTRRSPTTIGCRPSLEVVCRDVVAVVTDVIRRNEGVLRAAMQYKAVQPARWITVRETGVAIIERSMPLLLARMGRGRQAAKTADDRLRLPDGVRHADQRGAEQAAARRAARPGDDRPAGAGDVPAARSRSARRSRIGDSARPGASELWLARPRSGLFLRCTFNRNRERRAAW